MSGRYGAGLTKPEQVSHHDKNTIQENAATADTCFNAWCCVERYGLNDTAHGRSPPVILSGTGFTPDAPPPAKPGF
jgi:hypothetical protein